MKVLISKKTFWLIAFAAAIKAFIGYGHAPFTASFFLRNHTAEIAGLADGLQRADARRVALQASRASLEAARAEQLAYVALFTSFGGAALPGAAP